MRSGRRKLVWVVAMIAGLASPLAAEEGDSLGRADQEKIMSLYNAMIRRNLDQEYCLSSSQIDSLMRKFASRPLGERIAAWAKYFASRGDVGYRFGLDEGGYVKRGLLVDDFETDCVLFVYRVTELARSTNAEEAVQFAFGTRFFGAVLEEVVSPEGFVDYDNPVHKDYAIEMIRSGIWGEDVSETIGPLAVEEKGTDRFPAGSVKYVPKDEVDYSKLRAGDIIYFVTDEESPGGRAVRRAGAIVGHMGIVVIDDGKVLLAHAASKPLPGLYERAGAVKVPLEDYLRRVETFKGIIVTRIKEI